MPKYKVYLVTEASTIIEVEAEDQDSAIVQAFEGELPYAGAFDTYELGDWLLGSDMYPNAKNPLKDVEEIIE